MATYSVFLCQNGTEVDVEDNGLTLSEGDVISFSSSTGDVICGTVGEQQGPAPAPPYTAITTYDSCYECMIFNVVTYANAAEDVCVVVCTSRGTTTVSVEPPHPVWTALDGTEVIQMNAVTLGGNGLNS
jgi:hypothetical protein